MGRRQKLHSVSRPPKAEATVNPSWDQPFYSGALDAVDTSKMNVAVSSPVGVAMAPVAQDHLPALAAAL